MDTLPQIDTKYSTGRSLRALRTKETWFQRLSSGTLATRTEKSAALALPLHAHRGAAYRAGQSLPTIHLRMLLKLSGMALGARKIPQGAATQLSRLSQHFADGGA